MKAGKFTFVTCTDLPDGDPDDHLVLSYLADYGYETDIAIWDDTAVNWSQAGICVLRSTWDYHLKYDKFLGWLGQTAEITKVVNDPSLVIWNSKKNYLVELQKQNISVIPTAIVKKFESLDTEKTTLSQVLAERGWTKAVIKPAIGLSTFGVEIVSSDDEQTSQSHFEQLLETGDVLVQPYMEAVQTSGEKALVFFDGKFSHAVRKSPFQQMATAGHAGETIAKVSHDEITLAERTLAVLNEYPVFARVDLVSDDAGAPNLMELELIEPSLWVSMHPPAVRKFAEVLISRCSKELELSLK